MSQGTPKGKWSCQYETIVAIADKPRSDGIVVAECACLDIAHREPDKFHYDSITKELTMSLGVGAEEFLYSLERAILREDS